jgi:hypothetical protein
MTNATIIAEMHVQVVKKKGFPEFGRPLYKAVRYRFPLH